MNYRLIHKSVDTQPKTGSYSDWKVQISEECFKQCIYCTINEVNWGGIDHYHIDHYRPKSIFKDLENDICNLFYACPVCNRFKSDDWPNEPDLNLPSYPDPSLTDFSTLFEYDETAYQLNGRNISAKYIINRLYLNRPQLIYERREAFLKNKELDLFNNIVELAKELSDADLLKQTFETLGKLRNHLAKRDWIRPYKLAEIRKP
ncbi:HNH endonuclease [Pedobacter boryungensis]|uniref:HNH endonuclease n=1 Tax=Pedobacter boryungensis TaxID=869962 RepID=A0ABX2DCR7_9SPHI|nr:HNH endonuclease [Pedobacter boryungensis]NQX31223.1 HNH endonuclease [Pedobacter boryungensis]